MPGTARPVVQCAAMEQFKPRLLEIVSDPAVLQRLAEPVELASGGMSDVFIDGKLAVESAENLATVGAAMVAAARHAGAEFDAVGGLVLGAVPFAFAVVGAAGCKWFLIRKEPKGRGTNRWVEGTRLEPGMRIMLVDDVVTTGGSIQMAYERVCEEGAQVTFASTLVDRGDVAGRFFDGVGVPYVPLLGYADLDISPVGG